jgi:GH35 family endo-1,4-beta-xylanase
VFAGRVVMPIIPWGFTVRKTLYKKRQRRKQIQFDEPYNYDRKAVRRMRTFTIER